MAQNFSTLLKEIKTRIQEAQTRAILSVNSELIRLYWDIGRIIDERQKKEGWGASVIPRLAKELSGELSEIKGFSSRNMERMVKFYRLYSISARPVPEFILWSIPWGHHVLLMGKIKDHSVLLWYMKQITKNHWSRRTLESQIKNNAHTRQGKAITNFKDSLPEKQSILAEETLKDPYIFDFLTLQDTFHERELEVNLLKHLQEFLIELGQGFAFVGRQYYLERGKFKAEYAGKMNLYLNIVDDVLKTEADAPSIGLILCQDKNQIEAEYTLRGNARPIGISEYELTRSLPQDLKSALPTIEEIEKELSGRIKEREED